MPTTRTKEKQPQITPQEPEKHAEREGEEREGWERRDDARDDQGQWPPPEPGDCDPATGDPRKGERLRDGEERFPEDLDPGLRKGR